MSVDAYVDYRSLVRFFKKARHRVKSNKTSRYNTPYWIALLTAIICWAVAFVVQKRVVV